MAEALTPRMQWLNEVAEWEGKPAPFPTDCHCGKDHALNSVNCPVHGRISLLRSEIERQHKLHEAEANRQAAEIRRLQTENDKLRAEADHAIRVRNLWKERAQRAASHSSAK